VGTSGRDQHNNFWEGKIQKQKNVEEIYGKTTGNVLLFNTVHRREPKSCKRARKLRRHAERRKAKKERNNCEHPSGKGEKDPCVGGGSS